MFHLVKCTCMNEVEWAFIHYIHCCPWGGKMKAAEWIFCTRSSFIILFMLVYKKKKQYFFLRTKVDRLHMLLLQNVTVRLWSTFNCHLFSSDFTVCPDTLEPRGSWQARVHSLRPVLGALRRAAPVGSGPPPPSPTAWQPALHYCHVLERALAINSIPGFWALHERLCFLY